jgi:hypothetical protein
LIVVPRYLIPGNISKFKRLLLDIFSLYFVFINVIYTVPNGLNLIRKVIEEDGFVLKKELRRVMKTVTVD